MKDFIGNLLLKLYLVILRLYGRWILKCKVRLTGAVFLKTYIKAFDIFSDKTLKYHSNAAQLVNNKIFDCPDSDDVPIVDSDDVDALHSAAMSDNWVKQAAANYHLVDAAYYSYGISTDLLKEKSDEAIVKAKSFKPDSEPIDTNAVASIDKNTKREIKILKKEIKRLNTDKVESEKLKLIEPITIKSKHLAFAASIFSTLFLISGFIYSKLFLGYFDIEVGDFFSASDYISSSVDTIFAVLISTILGIFAFLWGASGALSRKLHEEQFETERKGTDYVVPAIVFTSSIGLVLISYQTGEIASLYLYPLILFLIIELAPKLPIWKYIHNKEVVGAVFISTAYFALHLGITIHDKITDVTSGKYSGPYALQFNSEYNSHANSEFVSANNSYIFLWNQESRKIDVIPKDGVSEFRAK